MLIDLIDFLEPTLMIVGSRGLGKLKGCVPSFRRPPFDPLVPALTFPPPPPLVAEPSLAR